MQYLLVFRVNIYALNFRQDLYVLKFISSSPVLKDNEYVSGKLNTYHNNINNYISLNLYHYPENELIGDYSTLVINFKLIMI